MVFHVYLPQMKMKKLNGMHKNTNGRAIMIPNWVAWPAEIGRLPRLHYPLAASRATVGAVGPPPAFVRLAFVKSRPAIGIAPLAYLAPHSVYPYSKSTISSAPRKRRYLLWKCLPCCRTRCCTTHRGAKVAVRVAVGVALQVAVVGRGGRSRRSLPRTGKLALRIPLGTAKNECRPALRRRTGRPLPSVWMAPAGCPRRCWCI